VKIAFDVHKTIIDNPEFFKPLMKILMHTGNDVCIVSGPPSDQIYKELKLAGFDYGIHYRMIYSVVDFAKNITNIAMSQDGDGNWWCDDTIWWTLKGQICKKYDIESLIDNDIRYKPEVSKNSTFIFWNNETKELYYGH